MNHHDIEVILIDGTLFKEPMVNLGGGSKGTVLLLPKKAPGNALKESKRTVPLLPQCLNKVNNNPHPN
jgi:hypothetical protein